MTVLWFGCEWVSEYHLTRFISLPIPIITHSAIHYCFILMVGYGWWWFHHGYYGDTNLIWRHSCVLFFLYGLGEKRKFHMFVFHVDVGAINNNRKLPYLTQCLFYAGNCRFIGFVGIYRFNFFSMLWKVLLQFEDGKMGDALFCRSWISGGKRLLC